MLGGIVSYVLVLYISGNSGVSPYRLETTLRAGLFVEGPVCINVAHLDPGGQITDIAHRSCMDANELSWRWNRTYFLGIGVYKVWANWNDWKTDMTQIVVQEGFLPEEQMPGLIPIGKNAPSKKTRIWSQITFR